jgi:hypothetical protein
MLAHGNGTRATLRNHASRAQTRTTTPHARRDAGSADTRNSSMQYGEPKTGATPQRAARVLPHANIGHKDDLVAVDVDVASAAARSVGHGAGVAAEDAGDGAGVGSLFFVKSGELRQVEAEVGRARGHAGDSAKDTPVQRKQRGVPSFRAERRARGQDSHAPAAPG